MATGRLAEVEQDAMRINAKRFRDQEETLQYEALKAEGVVKKTPEQVLSEVQNTTSPDQAKEKVELVEPEKVKEANASAKEVEGDSDQPGGTVGTTGKKGVK